MRGIKFLNRGLRVTVICAIVAIIVLLGIATRVTYMLSNPDAISAHFSKSERMDISSAKDESGEVISPLPFTANTTSKSISEVVSSYEKKWANEKPIAKVFKNCGFVMAQDAQQKKMLVTYKLTPEAPTLVFEIPSLDKLNEAITQKFTVPDLSSEIPFPAGSVLEFSSKIGLTNNVLLEYNNNLSIDSNISFYKSEMPKMGWALSSPADTLTYPLLCKKGNHSCMIDFEPCNKRAGTIVSIMYLTEELSSRKGGE